MKEGWEMRILTPHFGVVLSGMDVGAFEQDEADVIRKLLYSHKIVLIRGVHFGAEGYVRFARLLGEPLEPIDSGQRHPDQSQISIISAVPPRDERFFPLAMMYSKTAPKWGGELAFVDMGHVYDQLPQELRLSIDGAYLPNELDSSAINPRPIVLLHPITGRKALWIHQGLARSIGGMGDGESRELFGRLWARVVADPSLYVHRWEDGEILIWDNRSVIHRMLSSRSSESGLLLRIGISDEAYLPQEYETAYRQTFEAPRSPRVRRGELR